MLSLLLKKKTYLSSKYKYLLMTIKSLRNTSLRMPTSLLKKFPKFRRNHCLAKLASFNGARLVKNARIKTKHCMHLCIVSNYYNSFEKKTFPQKLYFTDSSLTGFLEEKKATPAISKNIVYIKGFVMARRLISKWSGKLKTQKQRVRSNLFRCIKKIETKKTKV